MLREIYDAELMKLRETLFEMGDNAVQMFSMCMDDYLREDLHSFFELKGMEKQQERREKEIEETAGHLITLQQPVAKETREVICAVRIAANWRKISSHITDISEYRKKCSEACRPEMNELQLLQQMTKAAEDMMTEAAGAYRFRDWEKAVQTAQRDDEIDRLFWEIRKEIMAKKENKASAFISALIPAEHIERIGDHAANICEEVVYLEKYELVKLN